MNKNEIKQIILEEIQAVINEQTEDERIAQAMETGDEDELEALAMGALDRAEQMAADSRPEEGEDDFSDEDTADAQKDFRDESDAMFGKPSFVEEEGLEEMARTSNVFKIKDGFGLKDVLQFMQRVNNVLKKYKSPGQKRPKKRFTPEEMKALAAAMVNPDGFTSKDIIANTSYNSPAQANKFLKALEMKGLITLTSQLKKSMEPTRDPDAPETRGRKRRDAEFDMSDDPMADLDALGLGGDIDLSDPLAENIHKKKNTEVGGKPDPRYGRLTIDFASDVDKALYITANALVKSKREPEFLKFLSGLGYTQAEIRSEGKKIKDELKKQVQKHPDFTSFSKMSELTGELKIKNIASSPKSVNENNNTMSELEKYIKQVIKEAKNPLAEKMKDIENQGRKAALETKLAAIAEMIDETNQRLTRLDEDEEFREMMDKGKVKDIRKQLKELEKAQSKLQKEYGKASGGMKKSTVVDEDAPIDEDAVDNAVDEIELEEDNLRFEGLSESVKRMQKLANLKG